MEAKQKLIGYARISSQDQNAERQLMALKEAGVPEANIYVDKASGKNFNRFQYKRMLKKIDSNTILFVKSIDRLGRSYRELSDQWGLITKEKGADVVVLDMPILDTRRDKDLLGTFISDLILALLSYVAESEYLMIHQRQSEGIAAAKARGVRFGRPTIPLPKDFDVICRLWRKGEITASEAARRLGMPLSSFRYRATNMKQAILGQSPSIKP